MGAKEEDGNERKEKGGKKCHFLLTFYCWFSAFLCKIGFKKKNCIRYKQICHGSNSQNCISSELAGPHQHQTYSQTLVVLLLNQPGAAPFQKLWGVN